MENLCVSEGRVGGSLRRNGFSPFFAPPLPLAVTKGCADLEPSRYTANAFRPSFHPMMYAFIISSTLVSTGILNVFEIAPEINGWTAATILTCPCHWIERAPFAGFTAETKTAAGPSLRPAAPST